MDDAQQLFDKMPQGKVVDEFKLRVVYVPTTTPSPIPEDSELGSSAHSSVQENGISHSAMPQSVARTSAETTKEKSSERKVAAQALINADFDVRFARMPF